MGIFDSFRKRSQNAPKPAPVENGASLQLVFSAPLSDDAAHLQSLIRAYDPTLRAATVAGVATETPGEAGTFLGQVEWGAHVVQVVAFAFPMPAEVVEKCVAPASYQETWKPAIRAQTAHALLFYKGQATNVQEQFIAVALVAGALSGENGLAVLNEGALTSVHAGLLTGDLEMKPSEFLRTLPPLYLFAGFVKYNVQDVPGVWMRTYGLDVYGLPNLATHVDGHNQGSRVFDIFCNVSSYMMAQGPVLEPGHTMQIGDEEWMRLRQLNPNEMMLDDGAPLLVAEFIGPEEANKHIFGSERAH